MPTRHAVARVTFTANRELVRKAVEEGWSAKAIYEQNQPKLASISYRQFVRYVNEMRNLSPAPDTSGPPQPQRIPDVRPPQPADARTFNHDQEIKQSARDRILGTTKKG